MNHRLPDSRIKNQSLINSARQFVDHSIEGLRTSTCVSAKSLEVIYPSSTFKDRTVILGAGPRALTSAVKTEWNSKCNGDCLHCGDDLSDISALPIAKFKVDGNYWIFGQFCSPSCGLGYLTEHNEIPQVFSWTRQLFQSVFNITNNTIKVCPPRFMLKRYGGSLDKVIWKNTNFIASKMAPLSTFAMFAEVEHTNKMTNLYAETNSSLKNLNRPLSRETFPSKCTPTGKEPAILKFLSTDTIETPNASVNTKIQTQDVPIKKKKTRITPSLNTFMSDE